MTDRIAALKGIDDPVQRMAAFGLYRLPFAFRLRSAAFGSPVTGYVPAVFGKEWCGAEFTLPEADRHPRDSMASRAGCQDGGKVRRVYG